MWGQFWRGYILHENLNCKATNSGERQSSDEVSKPICTRAFALGVDNQDSATPLPQLAAHDSNTGTRAALYSGDTFCHSGAGDEEKKKTNAVGT